jgi:hypothetical protein
MGEKSCLHNKTGLSLPCESAFGVSIVVATDLKMKLDVFETFNPPCSQ